MVENDIYNSKKRYEKFKTNLKEFLKKPTNNQKKIYYCKNPNNLQYFERLFKTFSVKDLSYVRRNRLISTFKVICYIAEKDLEKLDRAEIEDIIIFVNKQYPAPKSRSDFVRDIKYLWKILFPEKDVKGRIDETITPYPVRHLSGRIDKSKEKRRKDKLTPKEFEDIINYFSKDVRIQCFLTLSLESLGRPQEILYLKLSNVEVEDNYAKLWISEHGKEGTGLLRCIDSYPYLIKWLEQHPFKKRKENFLFINTGHTNFGKQLTPSNINKMLRTARKELNIKKPITCYSFKRNGVTFRRLRGESDIDIQHTARWKSTKQIHTYDLSEPEESFKIELAKRGLIKDKKYEQYLPKTKSCSFCDHKNGFLNEFCDKCKRPLDREKIKQGIENNDKLPNEIKQLFEMIKNLQAEISILKNN